MLVAFLLCGPSLAGKSTLAALLAPRFAAAVVSADAINARRGLPYGAQGLSESVWAQTLQCQLDEAREHAAACRSVVVDDTLCYRWLRDRWREHCATFGLAPLLVVLRARDAEVLRRRARLAPAGEREVLDEARLRDHLARFDWPGPDEAAVELDEPVIDARLVEVVARLAVGGGV